MKKGKNVSINHGAGITIGLCLIVVALLTAVICGCQKESSGQRGQSGTPRLVVWSFNEEVGNFIDTYYKPAHPDIAVEYTTTPSDQYMSKLDPLLSANQGAPDIFVLESRFVRKYVESGAMLDLTDLYEAVKDRLIQYPVEVGSYNGRVYALSWQAAPGAMYYRRSLAEKYLGTSDPEKVQSYFSDINKALETAAFLKEQSGGRCYFVAGIIDLLPLFRAARSQPWNVNGSLTIDPVMVQLMDIAKTLHDRGLEARVSQMSEGWFAGVQGTFKDERGDAEIFSYFLPTWGLSYVLKPNGDNTAGDWAMIQGPVAYQMGGTWLGAWKNTRNPEAAREMVRYLTIDDSFLESLARNTGEFVSNTAVIDKIKNDYAESFLGGQNHYAAFATMYQNINGNLFQGTDQDIEPLFEEAINAYVNSEKTKEQALEDFRDQVANQVGL
ncbi:MAG: ABC transporter substrate-binding protein [Treponema sp.]|nr:ABC transporter substrate-binding protein [Treponema sp.]